MSSSESTDHIRPWTPAPNRFEKVFLILFAVGLLVFALNTVNRGAFLKRPMTDAQCFFRGAWAVWSDFPLYEITDDNGWHYQYPPSLAVLLRPFANAPPRHPDLSWTMPYPVSLFLWFVLNFAALAYAIILFGNALDRHLLNIRLPNGPLHRWWLLRMGALLAFLPVAGICLSRGQVSTFLLLSMVGFTVAYADKRPMAAGLWLSIGVTIKLYPIILVLVPILRRDWRCIATVVVGTITGLFIIPALLVGLDGTAHLYNQWLQRLADIITGVFDQVVSAELSPTQSDKVGFGPAIFRLVNLLTGQELTSLNSSTMAGHWFCSLAIFLLIIWTGFGRAWALKGNQSHDGKALLLFSSLIAVAIVPVVTVAEVHYWILGLPLYMFLVAYWWRCHGNVGFITWASLFGVFLWVGSLLIDLRLPGFLSKVGWLTFLITALMIYGSLTLHRLHKLAN